MSTVLVSRYSALQAEKKQIEKEMSVLRSKLMAVLNESGIEDGRGSKHYNIGDYELKSEKRVSVTIDPETAEEVLGDMFDWYTKKVIDEDKLEEGFLSGALPKEMLDKIIKRKETYALIVREKEMEDTHTMALFSNPGVE